MKRFSTVLVIAFVIATSLLEGITAGKLKEEKPEIQGNVVLRKPQGSRRNHSGYRKTLTHLENVSAVPFKVFSVNFNGSDEDLVDLNYETLWQNGSQTSTRIPLPNIEFFSAINESQLDHVVEIAAIDDPENLAPAQQSAGLDSFLSSLDHQPLKRRLKRLIFEPDNRIRLNTSTQAQKFPFSTAVKISTGCSGSLISSLHVLTSAHCLHDGRHPLTPISNLKVGLLRRNGKLRWIGVDNIKFPENWRREPNSPSFDYAVITLRRAHKRPFLKIGVIQTYRQQHKIPIHFASFPGDKKPNSLWYSHCKSRVISSLLICRCDATTGSSGAGTYVTTSLKEPGRNRVVIGILSGFGRVTLPDGRRKLFNFVTKLTRFKAKQICQWIGVGADCIGTASRNVSGRLRSTK